MQKIISLFARNYDGDRLVRDEIVPGAEWVVAGEGVATIKYDGTACMVRSGVLYRRFDAKRGKTPPEGWEAAQDPDPVTGHHPGWVPVGDGPSDQWHRDAWGQETMMGVLPDGTYELVGPKVQGNPYDRIEHGLLRHGWDVIDRQPPPRDFAGLRGYLSDHDYEGIVWHHPDGRMVKVKRRDFGLPWPMTAKEGV